MIPRPVTAAHSRTVLLPCGKHYATLWGKCHDAHHLRRLPEGR